MIFSENMFRPFLSCTRGKKLPCVISSHDSAAAGVFLVRALPPEKSPRPCRAGGKQKQASFQTDKPDVADAEGGSRYFSEISRQPAPPLPAATLFSFQSLPVLRRILALPPKSSSRQANRCGNFPCCSLPQSQPSEEIKTKEGRKPKAEIPSLKRDSASAGL